MKVLIIFNLLIGTLLVIASGSIKTTRPALQQTPTSVPADVVNSHLVVRDLAPTWVVPDDTAIISTFETQTPYGKLSLTFTATEIKVHNGDRDSFSLPIPSQYKPDYGTWMGLYSSQTYSGDQPSSLTHLFAFCQMSGLFIVDIDAREFKRLDAHDCTKAASFVPPFYALSWSPDGRFLAYYPIAKTAVQRDVQFYDALQKRMLSLDQIAGLTTSWLLDWSPDWNDQLYITDPLGPIYSHCPTQPQSLTDYRENAIVQRHRLTNAITVVACVQWEEIDFLKWITQDQLLFTGRDYRDGGTKEEELFVVDRRTRKTTNLGASIKVFSDRFFDNDKKLARIKVRVQQSEVLEPSDCALSILDLTILKETEVEPTYCYQPADITILENQRQLVYLNSAIPVDPTTTGNIPRVHVVNLDTHAVQILQDLSITNLGSPSPDNHFLMMVQAADDLRDIIFVQPYNTANVVIYDAQQRKTVYTNEWGAVFFGDGFFSWSPDSTAFAATASFDYMVTLGTPQFSTALNDAFQGCDSDPACRNRVPVWSPDGRFLLFYSKDGIKVMRRNDHVIIAITHLVDAPAYYVKAEWQSDGLLTVATVPRSGSEPLYTLNRWLVDPQLATKN